MNSINGNIRRRKRGMSGVEDDKKQFASIVKMVAKLAAGSAIAEAKALNIPVAYLRGKDVIQKHPDGHVEVIARILSEKPSILLKRGSILHAKNK